MDAFQVAQKQFVVKLFISPGSGRVLGTCWQAEDIDGNKARVWLARNQKGAEVYKYEFRYWNDEIISGEAASLFKLTKTLEVLLVRGHTGEYPEFKRTTNYYTGRMDKK